jgi:hypothetical protein
MPAQLSLTLLASALCLDLGRAVIPPDALARRPRWLVGLGASWLALAWVEPVVRPHRAWQSTYVLAAARVVAATPSDARIGAFNSGILGAFASVGRRRVVNLDGVVNHGALVAGEQRMLTEYIGREHVGFIADYTGSVSFADRIVAPGLRARLALVESVPIDLLPGETLGIWRFDASPEP